jgi:hypothetical protein
MNKTEVVHIELQGHAESVPVKQCKARNKQPLSNKFKLIPKYIPFLSQFIQKVSWDCAEKTLEIEIDETANFDSYNWFGGINKRMSEAQKTSFVDLDQDSLMLIFMDESNAQVACIKFCGLYLKKHYLEFGNYSIDHILSHSIILGYQESEIIKIESEDEDFRRSQTDENEIVDEEWQA